MAKTKNVWYCSSCGVKQSRWSGQCPMCQEWNTFFEEKESTSKNTSLAFLKKEKKPLRLSEISVTSHDRIHTAMQELDKALGGGIVPGSLILLGGEPGIGKSTLSLQIAKNISNENAVLYVSGEESLEQIALRAGRLQVNNDNILFSNETEVHAIAEIIDEIKPSLIIIDSIQVIYKNEIPSSPGSVVQVRETASFLMQIAKTLAIPIIIIGHVTKSGEIAGPRILEHLVDTVLYFEGDSTQNLRLVRSIKNRFGPTDEIAVFQMQANGLQEILNPSKLFIEDRQHRTSGSAIVPMMEGSRPLLIEAQALVTDTYFSNPSRRTTGLDTNRLALLLAVLEKKAGLKIQGSDVFVSITGGFKVAEPACDLGILLAISSSFLNKRIAPELTVIGEVGLSGEIRAVNRIEARIKEAHQMGFTHAIVPQKNIKALQALKLPIQIHPVVKVHEAIDKALG